VRTLSDHIFELVQNSLNAGARTIHVMIVENVGMNSFSITIKDDGNGIKPDHLPKIKNTFFTTRPRENRRIGLGLSFMDATCQRAGGELTITSEYRNGTTVEACMEHDCIDRPPLGDLSDLFTSLLLSTMENNVIWHLEHEFDERGYSLKNRATLDELNIFSYGESGVREKLYDYIMDKEMGIRKP